MANVSVRLQDDVVEQLDDEADESGLSRAEYIRSLIQRRSESEKLRSELAELRDDYDELQREHERALEEIQAEHEEELNALEEQYEARLNNLERQLKAANQKNERINELVRVHDREQTLAERKASAGLLTRAKWWFVGDAAARNGEG